MRAKYLSGQVLVFLFALSGVRAATTSETLTEAAKKRDETTVRFLLKERGRVNVNAVDAEGMTALLWATHWDDREMATALVGAGANVKATNRVGTTPLHEAATYGDTPMMEVLLKAGADPNAVRGEGDTPLIVAARTGVPDAVQLLLKCGAAVDAREKWFGETPLMVAVAKNHPRVVQILIDRGADVNAVSSKLEVRDRPFVDGTDGYNPPKGGWTPLLFAAREGAIESGKVVLAAGARTDVPLIAVGASGYVNAPEAQESGFSPLLIAVINQHYDFATMLVEHGANVNDGSLTAAIQMRAGPAVRIAQYGHFLLTPPVGSLEFIKLLIERGANVNATFNTMLPYKGMMAPRTPTPFYDAATYMDIPVMRLLIEKGANTGPLNDGRTPIIAIAQFDRSNMRPIPDKVFDEAIDLCLARGVDINGVGRDGNTAIHFAAAVANDHLIQYLARRGARVDVKNRAGFTPMDWAKGRRPGPMGAEAGTEIESTVKLLDELTNTSAVAALR